MMVTGRKTWLRAGVVAAGLGAGLLVGPGVAAADDGRGATAEQDRGGAKRSGGTVDRTPRSHIGARSRAAAGPAASTRNFPKEAGVQRVTPEVAPGVTPEVRFKPEVKASRTSELVSADVTAAATATRPPGPIRSAVLAAKAYIYGYPLMEYQRVRQTVGTVNTLYSLTSFANPDVDPIWLSIGGGKRPNVDTFYSLAELDLSQGPVVLSIPDMGSRYFSFQLTDPYTNVSAYIGSRTTGYGPGKYAITWEGGPQVDIPDTQTVLVPYSSMLALGRTLAGDEADQQSAIELMKQYALTPTGGTVSPVIPIPGPGIGYLNAISTGIGLNPPPAIDDPELAELARIGVGPGMRVADANLGLLSTIAVELAVRTTASLLPLLTALNQYAAALGNRGWATPDPAIGNYGTNYLLRAGVTEAGLLANTPEEAVYSAGLLRRDLLPLRGWGTTPYVLHFAPGEEPPVNAFWSVTVYDAAGELVPNALGRYSVSSSRPDELVRRPDGSIDIVFALRDPGDPGANWLKVPAGGRFSAYLRMYWPDQPILDGTWQPPPIVRDR
jgi:hypothetical protein